MAREWQTEWGTTASRAERTWHVPMEEGLVIVRTTATVAWYRPRYSVVRGGELVPVEEHEAMDAVDPAGARRRAYLRRIRNAGLAEWPGRVRLIPGHGLVEVPWGSWYAVPSRVTAQQCHVRSATEAEAEAEAALVDCEAQDSNSSEGRPT